MLTLTPGLAKDRELAIPTSGSNDSVYGSAADPIEQIGRGAVDKDRDGGFLSQILAKERELAKLRIRRSGENPRNIIEIGDIHFLSKRFPMARDSYINAIRLDKTNSVAYRKLINCYIALGNLDMAAQSYERLIRVNPSPEFRHEYILFQYTINQGNKTVLDSLLKEIKQLASENSTDSQILNTYGIFLGFIANKHGESKKYFKKAVLLDPDNFHAINNIGVCYELEGQLSSALEKFKEAVSLSPKYGSGYENIAGVYISQEKYSTALEVLEGAMSNSVQISDLWVHKIGWLLIKMEDYTKALSWHEVKLEQEPKNDFLLNNMGYCYLMLGDVKKARRCFSKAIDCFEANLGKPGFIADIRSINQYRNLMVLADKTEDVELVDSTARRLLSIDPNSSMAYYFRGLANIKKKNFIFARVCYEKSIELNPNAPEPYIDLSFIYEAMDGRFKDVIELIEGAPFSQTILPLITNNLAYAYIKNGDIAKAKNLLSGSKFKGHAALYATKGLLELYENNFSKAQIQYKKAIDNLGDKEKKFASQVWNYEQAAYWLKNKDYQLAKEKIDEALEAGDVSYAYNLARSLRSKVKTLVGK